MSSYPGFDFQVTARSGASRARRGRLTTPHGVVETPAFIFCATKAAAKACDPREVKGAAAQIILANTYHLMLQPGPDVIAAHGGLHRFMGWDGPMLTDSGGFQIFSMGHGGVAQEVKGSRGDRRPTMLDGIDEQGARFRSYIDGSRHVLTPEISIDIQRKLGADLIVVLDECTPYHVDRDYTARSLQMTHRWARRSLAAFDATCATGGSAGAQALYGIIQGGVYPDLRRESAEFIESLPFFGTMVGGCLGGDKEEMYQVVGYAMAHVRAERPVHLLGIGGVRDVFEGVIRGIDTFDCVHPTRVARHGGALVRGAAASGRDHLNLRNARFREDQAPLDPECDCPTCARFSRAYLHHLLRAGELLALQALTVHNIRFMTRLMAEVRQGIETDNLDEVRGRWLG